MAHGIIIIVELLLIHLMLVGAKNAKNLLLYLEYIKLGIHVAM